MIPLIDCAVADDAPAIHALVESAYRGDAARRGWTHEADLLGGQRTDVAAIAAIIASRDARILVARGDAGPMASVVVERKSDTVVYLGMLAVDPARQTGGLGKTMIAAAEAVGRDVFAATTMEMTVIERRTELIAYYRRRGFEPTGERRPFPYDDPAFGIPKSRDLDFIVLAKPLR